MSQEKTPAASNGQAIERSKLSLSPPAPAVKVLIRLYPDGFGEIYADGRIHLHTQKVLSAPGQYGEQLALEFADLTIPISHRGLDDATKLVTTFDSRPVDVAAHQTMTATLSALRILDAYTARVSP